MEKFVTTGVLMSVLTILQDRGHIELFAVLNTLIVQLYIYPVCPNRSSVLYDCYQGEARLPYPQRIPGCLENGLRTCRRETGKTTHL